MNIYFYIKLSPLIVVFLFSKVKAESFDSAFISCNITQEEVYLDNEDNGFEKAQKLYNDGNYSKSLEIAYSLIDTNKPLVKVKVNLLLGKIFERNKNNEKALGYLETSLFLLDKVLEKKDKGYNDDLELLEAELLLETAKVFAKSKMSNAKTYLMRLVNIRSINSKVLLMKGRAYNNLSIQEFQNKNYDQAEVYSLKSIDILIQLGKKKELSVAYIALANIYEVTNQREKALQTYFKALPFLQKKNDAKSLEYKEALYYNIAWTMYNLRDYKSFEYLERSYYLKDSIVDINLRKELKKIEQIHNIDLIRKEEETKRLNLERNNWFIGGVAVLISLLSLYFLKNYKSKQKELRLKLSLQELEQQKKLDDLQLESQKKILNATIDGKEAERKQIAEILHDNVSALLSSANMHLQASQHQFGEKLPPELEKTKLIIKEASTKIRDLSHHLISSILLKFGLEYALKDTAKKYSNSSIKIYTVISEITRYQQDFEIKIFNIIQELINNILKHSKASTAYIAMEESDDKLLIIIKDNGVGFVNKGEENTGIGLNQVEARVQILKGSFNVESSKEKGTKITLVIPIVKKELLTSLS